MRVRIVYYGPSRRITGKDEEQLEIPAETSAEEMIRRLIETYGEPMSWLLQKETGALRRSIIFAVNDEAVDPGEGRVLKDNDIFSIFPAVSGG